MKTLNRLLIVIIISIVSTSIYGQTEECLVCHSDNSLTYERHGKTVSLFVDETSYLESMHADLECTDCHTGFDPEDLPHREGKEIYKVNCSDCHETEEFENSIHSAKDVSCSDCHTSHEIQPSSKLAEMGAEFCITCHNSSAVKGYIKSVHYEKNLAGELSPSCIDCHGSSSHDIQSAQRSEEELHALCSTCHETAVDNFEKSLHGQALAHGKFLAPNCITCHNSHKIMKSNNPQSNTYKMNIPAMCGQCHKDGTRVSELKGISQRHVLEDYSESIHGDGLFRRGLIVTAVCTDCHFSHNILPHENPQSSINRKNIAGTCTKCHAQIEAVHVKVIEGQLWEKEPHKIPACIDCHQPHKVRRVVYEEKYTDQLCISCHSRKDIYKVDENGNRISLHVDVEKFENSAHKDNSCVKCHTNVSVSNNPVCLNSGPVDCSICHAEVVNDYEISTHGTLHAKDDENAPYCTDCHGKHDMLPKDDLSSPIFSKNIPNLCAKCHREGETVAQRVTQDTGEKNIVSNYTMSIHGKGLLQSGLMVTATCIDCHTSHRELPASDPQSTVNPNNIAETCATCHLGIYEVFKTSIHSPLVTKTDKQLPGCADCHQSHAIARVDVDNFRQNIIDQCGKCHEDVTDTYFDTFHGKVSKLGSVQTAKCSDCHGSHNILPPFNPNSTLSRGNIVETCKTCHPNSNRKFVGYLTHATHHDKDKYPFLYYTFWFMTILLVGTFSFFGLHTLLWLPRALAEKRKHKKGKK